ncbi:hypothetical protein [Myceligenerans pegani]|uniref:Transmembrane transport protein n=1 Tax=Myceligenerans pegani TaxID=2776917 RepID=A0ABR9MYW6_9MICO|nr:hypothetical protein [Myceligenerans sp. TRM 65318]MBE1876053.1 hypothetical protein [Myceligenerans sp. TRM 65318]MBE3018324.1 hypothetical protein [Myceligenerans sp. TRM 65318]
MTQEMPGVPAHEVVARLGPALSARARVRAVAMLVLGLAGAVFVTALWWTEPGPLPVRTQVGFALLSAVCLAWAGYGSWLLRRKVPLFAADQVVAAWIGLVASLATSALLVVVTVQRGAGPWAPLLVGAALTVVAATLLVRARRRRAALLRRERELTARDLETP